MRWNGLQALLLDLLIVFPGLVLYFFPKIPFKVGAYACASALDVLLSDVLGSLACVRGWLSIMIRTCVSGGDLHAHLLGNSWGHRLLCSKDCTWSKAKTRTRFGCSRRELAIKTPKRSSLKEGSIFKLTM